MMRKAAVWQRAQLRCDLENGRKGGGSRRRGPMYTYDWFIVYKRKWTLQTIISSVQKALSTESADNLLAQQTEDKKCSGNEKVILHTIASKSCHYQDLYKGRFFLPYISKLLGKYVIFVHSPAKSISFCQLRFFVLIQCPW